MSAPFEAKDKDNVLRSYLSPQTFRAKAAGNGVKLVISQVNIAVDV
jgi:hypothetical protein